MHTLPESHQTVQTDFAANGRFLVLVVVLAERIIRTV
jgi:hypothetical protein